MAHMPPRGGVISALPLCPREQVSRPRRQVTIALVSREISRSRVARGFLARFCFISGFWFLRATSASRPRVHRPFSRVSFAVELEDTVRRIRLLIYYSNSFERNRNKRELVSTVVGSERNSEADRVGLSRMSMSYTSHVLQEVLSVCAKLVARPLVH